MQLTSSAGETFEAYVSGPEDATHGILIIHDWWGVLPYNYDCTNHFGHLGYRALLIDLYDGHHPQNTKEAGEYMRSIDQEAANRKLRAALEFLKDNRPARKIAVLGWSFGGLQAQYATLQHPDLVDATIIYYCRIIFDRFNAGVIHGPVLAVFAEMERTWPDKQAALEHVMAELDKTLECHSYDADHGFVNPDSLRYDNDATEEARRVTLEFLDRYLA